MQDGREGGGSFVGCEGFEIHCDYYVLDGAKVT